MLSVNIARNNGLRKMISAIAITDNKIEITIPLEMLLVFFLWLLSTIDCAVVREITRGSPLESSVKKIIPMLVATEYTPSCEVERECERITLYIKLKNLEIMLKMDRVATAFNNAFIISPHNF